MRFIGKPGTELLYKETRIVLHVDNRYRGDIVKQIDKIKDLDADYSLEIKKKRTEEKGTAEGYIWSLINKIADKNNRDPVRVYKDFITKFTPHITVCFSTMNEARRSKEEWESLGIGYQVLKMMDYKEYVKCERVRGYSGWYYNETETFIRALENECKLLNIKLE